YPHYIHTAYVCYSERRPHGSFGRPRPFPISGSYGRASERLAGLAGGSACPTLLAKDLQALGARAFAFQPGSREGRACPTPTEGFSPPLRAGFHHVVGAAVGHELEVLDEARGQGVVLAVVIRAVGPGVGGVENPRRNAGA